MTVNKQLYRGGVPTTPDVNVIIDNYPFDRLTPGTVIPYDDIAKIIKCNPRSNRFRGVTSQWRDRFMTETGLQIAPAPDKRGHFKVLQENERVDRLRYRMKIAGAHIKRAVVNNRLIDRKQLTSENKKYCNRLRDNERHIMLIKQLKTPQQLPRV